MSSPRALPLGSRSPRAWREFKRQRLREISWPKQIRVRGGDYGAGLCPEIMTRRVHPHTDRNADLNRSPRSSFPWLAAPRFPCPGTETPRLPGRSGRRAKCPPRFQGGSLLGGRCWFHGPFSGEQGRWAGRGPGAGAHWPVGSAPAGRGRCIPGALPAPADPIAALEMEIRAKSLFITL